MTRHPVLRRVIREEIEVRQSYFAAVAAVRSLAHIAGTTASSEAFDILCATLDRRSWQEVVAAAVFHGFNHATGSACASTLPSAHRQPTVRPLPIRPRRASAVLPPLGARMFATAGISPAEVRTGILRRLTRAPR
jgi:hypothetical protein